MRSGSVDLASVVSCQLSVVSLHESGSSSICVLLGWANGQHAGPQQFAAGAAVHGPLEGFQSAPPPLPPPLSPIERRVFDHSEIERCMVQLDLSIRQTKPLLDKVARGAPASD
ncbi:MAG: hypothetical protein QOF70_574 [Acetobacteraceae bacterium]|jgi:hypothetical protein|nr:hypothetical protein [Acetobacteraceae bacterium]